MLLRPMRKEMGVSLAGLKQFTMTIAAVGIVAIGAVEQWTLECRTEISYS